MATVTVTTQVLVDIRAKPRNQMTYSFLATLMIQVHERLLGQQRIRRKLLQ
jgi:hypothetical protein